MEIDYRDHVPRADRITYNSETGEVQAEGHVRLTGGVNDETIEASHGSYNIRTQTGTFYDVSGSPCRRTTTAAWGQDPGRKYQRGGRRRSHAAAGLSKHQPVPLRGQGRQDRALDLHRLRRLGDHLPSAPPRLAARRPQNHRRLTARRTPASTFKLLGLRFSFCRL